MQDYKLLNQICSFRQNVTPFLKRDTSTRCDVRIEPSDLQFQGSTNLISHQPNDLDWALCRPGRAGLGRNRRSEWGGHIFKGKMNIIKMITAIHCDVATAPQKLLDKLHPTVTVLEWNYNRLYAVYIVASSSALLWLDFTKLVCMTWCTLRHSFPCLTVYLQINDK